MVKYPPSCQKPLIFNDYLAAFDIEIKQHLKLLEYNSSDKFIDLAKTIDSYKKEDFEKIIKQISIPYEVEPYFEFNCESDIPPSILMNKTYRTLYVEMIRRKRNVNFRSEVTFTLEYAIDLLASSIEYPSYQRMKECLVGALLRMLDTSVVGNVLQYQDGKIERGFHYGENSDVMMPYSNKYVLCAIEQFYWRLEEEFTEEKETKKCNFDNFWADFLMFLDQKYYLNTIIDPRDYKQLRQHFDVGMENIGKLIRKLHFKTISLKRDDVYSAINRFVQNYTWSL